MRWARGGPRGPSAFIPVEEVSLEGLGIVGRWEDGTWNTELVSLEIAVLKLSLRVPDSDQL